MCDVIKVVPKSLDVYTYLKCIKAEYASGFSVGWLLYCGASFQSASSIVVVIPLSASPSACILALTMLVEGSVQFIACVSCFDVMIAAQHLTCACKPGLGIGPMP